MPYEEKESEKNMCVIESLCCISELTQYYKSIILQFKKETYLAGIFLSIEKS